MNLFLPGKLANKAASGSGPFNQLYTTDVGRGSNTIQCLDFYYYITSTASNAKMQVGWELGGDTQPIVEVTALADNKWQNSRTSFEAPSSPYQGKKDHCQSLFMLLE